MGQSPTMSLTDMMLPEQYDDDQSGSDASGPDQGQADASSAGASPQSFPSDDDLMDAVGPEHSAAILNARDDVEQTKSDLQDKHLALVGKSAEAIQASGYDHEVAHAVFGHMAGLPEFAEPMGQLQDAVRQDPSVLKPMVDEAAQAANGGSDKGSGSEGGWDSLAQDGPDGSDQDTGKGNPTLGLTDREKANQAAASTKPNSPNAGKQGMAKTPGQGSAKAQPASANAQQASPTTGAQATTGGSSILRTLGKMGLFGPPGMLAAGIADARDAISNRGSSQSQTGSQSQGTKQPQGGGTDFARAMGTVIDVHEGGFQNRTDDKGNFTPTGELKGTKFGISARSYPDEDIKNLTRERAAQLYQRDYGAFGSLNDQKVLTKVLDLAVNMQGGGNGRATEILQNAINASGGQVKVDGQFGAGTAAAANAIDPDTLMKNIIDQAQQTYKQIETRNPKQQKWFANWDARAQWMPGDPNAPAPTGRRRRGR